jgi:hypothetical protein
LENNQRKNPLNNSRTDARTSELSHKGLNELMDIRSVLRLCDRRNEMRIKREGEQQ